MLAASKLKPGAAVALTPPTYTFSDFPALIAWFKFNDGAGASGTDLNEMTGTVTKEEVIDVGAGDPWATASAITVSNTGGAEIYCRHESGSTVPAKVREIGSKSVIVQIDVNITGGDTDAAFLEIGNANNASQMGLSIAQNGGTQLTWKAYGVTGDSTKYSVSDFEDISAMGRAVLTFVWNRNADSKGVWSLYKNGILNGAGGQYAFAADPGEINITTAPGMSIGSKGSLGNVCIDATIYDLKWFYTTTIPSNIDTIVADMAADTNALPDSAKDIIA